MTSEIKQRLYNDLDIFFIETSSFFFNDRILPEIGSIGF
jgi:hypothetical protein